MSLKALVPGALATGAAGATSIGCYFQMSHETVSSASEVSQVDTPDLKEPDLFPESKSLEEIPSIPSSVSEPQDLKVQAKDLGDTPSVATPDSVAGADSSSQSNVEKSKAQPKPDSVPQAENPSIVDNIQSSENQSTSQNVGGEQREQSDQNRSSYVPPEKTYGRSSSQEISNSIKKSGKSRRNVKTKRTRGPLFSICVSLPVPLPFFSGCE